MARVEAKIRGPGMVPSSIACLISTSPYPAPSVSTSRIVVNPCSKARRAATVARAARSAIPAKRMFAS